MKQDINTASKYNDSLISPVGIPNLFTRFCRQGKEPSGKERRNAVRVVLFIYSHCDDITEK
jgi:cytochrome oxidase Cu insertion factor (SCO1/SenC/PrrC family)